MSITFVTKWYRGIPPVERKLPVIYHNGKMYTPDDIYREVVKGTKLGEELQEKLERLRAANSLSIDDLKELDYVARKRVEEVIKNLPKDFTLVAISNGERRFVKPNEFMNTKLFEKAVESEKKKIIKILRG